MLNDERIIKLPLLPIWLCKGSTAYELQLHRLCIRWCYLMGGNWKTWYQLNRFYAWVVPKDDQCQD